MAGLVQRTAWEARLSDPEEPWPMPPERVCDLFRDLATRMQAEVPEIADGVWRAGQGSLEDAIIADDPMLAEMDRRFVHSTMAHWIVANIDEPGKPVEPTLIPEVLAFSRDLALRGVDNDEIAAWRAGQRVWWSWWLRGCFAATNDPEDLRQLIEVSANSLTTFLDDSIATVAAHIGQVRSELAKGPLVQRQATVQLLLQGAPIARDRAEAQLGYALTGHHLGVIVWVDREEHIGGLEQAAELVMRASGAERRLTLVAGIAAQWIWLPVNRVPAQADLEAILVDIPGVRVALGRPGKDVVGFRRTHLDAVAAQALLARLRSRRRAVRFEDVQLIALMSSDITEARQFIADTLDGLAGADPVLRQTVRVFIGEQFNTSRTADRLFAHRNTIDRRLVRVDELLPRPLAENPAAVDAALAMVELQDE